MTVQYLRAGHLAQRWSMSVRILERWRWERCGPPYMKINGRILYRLDDIEAYEAQSMIDLRATRGDARASEGGC